ncbi:MULTISPECIES: N-acyl-D-amino-acid deacylase family protein [Providencia]|uniref:N-acyl-D-amino-acid deacylase family protein n=1 Tax=Providencia TaxID=586 RepID=UPI00197D3A66|nr:MULTISPECIES: D-aminoacylase [Providencia]MBN4864708.1 D-aminoacylase [Providencia stuartii]MBN4873846.1 D-aminoacylase [Providencia stuartii]MBN4878537.1 D-aminoacylase [Providencia stuartii]MBN4883230.1 D-aminoacylase [Providencia stuartii]
MKFDYVFKSATVIDGSGKNEFISDVAIKNGRVIKIAENINEESEKIIDCSGLILSPGFIDVHTHDDLIVIDKPEYIEKTSQGVTTIIVGNCGISAACATLKDEVPDPINLLGELNEFNFVDLASYKQKINEITPTVNVATLIGHTTLRNNCVSDLLKPATQSNIAQMKRVLESALNEGALGLSTGLSYGNAINSSTEEICELAELLAEHQGIYTTHMRTEYDGIIDAMHEAFHIGRHAKVPVQISHHKCAGAKNWGRTKETLALIEKYQAMQDINCDCYPYRAGSSNLDITQVTEDYDILVTWSMPFPDVAGKTLKDIAIMWNIDIYQVAEKIVPAGAIYFQMHEDDVRRVLQHPSSMVGSDGLPRDPNPHPRLWGTFPRVISHYSRDEKLFPMTTAIYKMTGMSAQRFSLKDRGLIKENFFADIVLFDPIKINETSTFQDPKQKADGIEYVFVNGVLTYTAKEMTGDRAGKFLERNK